MNPLVRRTRLAKLLGIPMPTVKYYTLLGLFYFSKKTEHGQYLYDPEEMRQRYEKIRVLKDKRLTILEIKDQLDIQGLLSKC